ncbi:MAG: XdhC family protein, partial [Armatimonadota bacterium]|nr:XdhC family protein [Armatimonadota bacterium]
MLKDDTLIWNKVRECVDGHRPCALAIVIEAVGSTPQRIGAKLLLEGGSTLGTVGGGMVEAQTVEVARVCVNKSVSCIFTPRTSEKDEKYPLRCGGRMSILIDGCLERHSHIIGMLTKVIESRGKGFLIVRMSVEDGELLNHDWMFVALRGDNFADVSGEGIPTQLLTTLAYKRPCKPILKRFGEREWIYAEPI